MLSCGLPAPHNARCGARFLVMEFPSFLRHTKKRSRLLGTLLLVSYFDAKLFPGFPLFEAFLISVNLRHSIEVYIHPYPRRKEEEDMFSNFKSSTVLKLTAEPVPSILRDCRHLFLALSAFLSTLVLVQIWFVGISLAKELFGIRRKFSR